MYINRKLYFSISVMSICICYKIYLIRFYIWFYFCISMMWLKHCRKSLKRLFFSNWPIKFKIQLLILNLKICIFLVSAGQDIQGTSVIANLPILMRQNPTETLRRVLPKVRVSWYEIRFKFIDFFLSSVACYHY